MYRRFPRSPLRPWLRATTLVVVAFVALLRGSSARAGDDVTAALRRVLDAGTPPDLPAERVADRAAVRRVYQWTAFRPVWVRDGRPSAAAEATIGVLGEAATRGLDPADYDADRLVAAAGRLRGRPTADEVARFDTALTVVTMQYAADAYGGRVDPASLHYELESPRKRLDLPSFVLALAAADDPAQRLAALDPPMPLFANLRAALARMRALASRPDLPEVPDDLRVLHPRDRNAAVPALRGRLAALGDLDTGEPPADPTVYDGDVVVAVRRFQARHGRDADGVVGRMTLHDLRVPLAARAQQIVLTMERLRWFATDAGRFIVVNIPAFRLEAFDGRESTPRVSMNVVVGSIARNTTTPIVHAHLRTVVFRPYWNIPDSIARKEILPRAARDPRYLARERIERVDGRLRQVPGPENALGLVKFVFPNPFDVYLHDTPQKAYFARSRRDLSHGCIRIADAPALAEFVLGWDRERIAAAMTDGPDDHEIDVPEGIAVYVLYTTVGIDGGELRFSDDIYGYDAVLARALADRYNDRRRGARGDDSR